MILDFWKLPPCLVSSPQTRVTSLHEEELLIAIYPICSVLHFKTPNSPSLFKFTPHICAFPFCFDRAVLFLLSNLVFWLSHWALYLLLLSSLSLLDFDPQHPSIYPRYSCQQYKTEFLSKTSNSYFPLSEPSVWQLFIVLGILWP